VTKQHHKNNIHSKKYKRTYYIRTSGKYVKTEPKKEELESSNRNGALDFIYRRKLNFKILQIVKIKKILRF
jgi:hypothetical protein